MGEGASDRQHEAGSLGRLGELCSLGVPPSLAHAKCGTGEVMGPQAPL